MTWSGTLGFEYRVKPRFGVMFGYHALGIDIGSPTSFSAGSEPSIRPATQYDVTHYGPFVALRLRMLGR